MKNILLIAILFSIILDPSRVVGKDRYAARDTNTVNLLIKEADSLRYQALEYDKAQLVFQKAIELTKTLKHREGEIKRKYAYNLACRDKLDSALMVYNDLFNFFLELKDYSGLAETYYSTAAAFEKKGKNNEAESFYLEGINLAEKHQLQQQHCKFLRMLSNFYDTIGQTEKAVEAAQQALHFSKKYKNEKDIASSSMQLGNMFLALEDPQTALKHFKVHFNHYEKEQELEQMAKAQVNFGNCYSYQPNKDDSALYHFNKAIALFNASGNKILSVDAMFNAASIYYRLDSITQFLKFLDDAEAMYTNASETIGILNVMSLKAEYLKTISEHTAAIALSRKGLKLSIESDNLQLRLDFYEKLAENYQSTEQFDSATFFNRAYLALYDSIYTDEFRDGLISAEMEHRYNAFEREKEIELLKLLNERRLYIMWGLGLLAFLILIIATIGLRALHHKRNLAETRLKLHEQKIEQLLSNQELKSINAMMEGQDKERKRIAQDLHDRLGSMLSTVKHHFSAIETRVHELQDQNKAQYNTAIALLDDAVREVRHISHDMLSGTLVKFGLSAALQDLKNTIEVPGKLTVELNTFGLDQRLDNEVEIAVYRIIQELVGNTLKHAKASELDIQLTLSANNLNVMVADNGVGFKPEALLGDGIGMKNVSERINRLNGTYHLDSELGRGTTFVFDIPIPAAA
jgi:two-component system, NarL family, sensor kinase